MFNNELTFPCLSSASPSIPVKSKSLRQYINVMILAAASFLLFSSASAQQLSGEWPPVEKVTPANADWTAKLLSGAQIPNLPVTAAGNPVWDTSDEIVSCVGNPSHWALTYDDGPRFVSL